MVTETVAGRETPREVVGGRLRGGNEVRTILSIVGLVALFFLLAVTSVRNKSTTNDETWHVVSGLVFLRTGDLRMNTDHPYFPNALVALPLAKDKSFFLPGVKDERFRQAQADFLSEGTAALNGGVKDRGKHVLPPRYIFLPHVIMASVAAAFLLAYGFLLQRYAGSRVALLAVILLGFSPTFLAHSRLATTELPPTAAIFLASFVLWRAHRARTRRTYVMLLIAFVALSFLALMAKYTSLFVAPVWLALAGYSAFVRSAARRVVVRAFHAVAAVIAVLTLWLGGLDAAYGFQRLTLQETKHEDTALIREEKEMLAQKGGTWLVDIYERYRLPFPYYVRGVMFNMVFKHILGHESFFLGKYKDVGPWYYPVAFLVKETVPFVIGALVFAPWALAQLRRGGATGHLVFLWIPPAVLALIVTFSHVKIGIRHMLPVYPFLALGVAVMADRFMTSKRRRVIVVVGALSVLATVVRVHPHYLSYFNAFAGGSANGYRWLLDSNFDWGQNEILAKQIVAASDRPIDYEGSDLPRPGNTYLIRLAEIYARPRNRDKRDIALKDLLEEGTLRIVDRSLPTHWVVYYPVEESSAEK